MDAKTVRAMLEHNFEHSGSDPVKAHEIYAEDAVLEFPQSGERFVGVENFREWRRGYPANVSFEFREVRGAGDIWVVELSVRYDDGPENFGISIHEFRDELIVRETIYVAEGFEAPEWRAEWRAAP
jgi:hypothetical protein